MLAQSAIGNCHSDSNHQLKGDKILSKCHLHRCRVSLIISKPAKLKLTTKQILLQQILRKKLDIKQIVLPVVKEESQGAQVVLRLKSILCTTLKIKCLE